MKLSAEEKRRTLQQLSEMFGGTISYSKLRNLCDQHNWNLDHCVDNLISSGNQFEQSANVAVHKIAMPQGAIPKSSSSITAVQSNDRNERTFYNANCSRNVQSKEQRIAQQIKAGYRIIVIMRGAPGCGKSYLAQSLVTQNVPNFQDYYLQDFVFSTDDYFYDAAGRYKYRMDCLTEAHSFNLRRVEEKAAAGWSPIFVDNTNMQLWEMMPYVQVAVKYGYLMELLEPSTPWRNSASKLAIKNRHRVPRDKIQAKLDKYEKGNVGDLLKLLKNTKYSVPLPQMRSFPPIKVQEHNTEANKNMHISQNDDTKNLPQVDNATPNVISDSRLDGAKSQRKSSRLKSTLEISPNDCVNILQGNIQQDDWTPYESEVTDVWQNATPQTEKNTNPPDKRSETKVKQTLLDLLKESESEVNEVTPRSNDDNQLLKLQEQDNKFQRHSINCPNENMSFSSLRQIYPNKEVAGLWDLFIKCNGDIDWAIDILLKEDELSMAQGEDVPDIGDSFQCDCGNIENVVENNMTTAAISLGAGIKPQRRANRVTRPSQRLDLQEMKQKIENRVVLGNDHYSDYLRKMRNIRNGTKQLDPNSKSTQLNVETQTDIEEDQDDDVDEILEISLGDELVQQLGSIFKTETAMACDLPCKRNTSVFIPRALAKELYMLWVESAYNQMEEQRQQMLLEDENFARLLKNPVYDHFKQSPSNIQELLDMEVAWNIYNNDIENEQRETLRQKPVDLAEHLTQMKLCESFPNIPRETLLEIFAAHNNKYSETIQVLQGNIDRENEALNLQAKVTAQQQGQQQQQLQLQPEKQVQKDNVGSTHSNESNGGSERTYKALQPDEAKRLALRDFEEARNLAAHHCQLKAECYSKAKEAIQKNNSSVAVYYSEIANLHKKRIELYNQRAANCIVSVHKHTQNNPDLLDLHYLHVVEAIGCLDLFLDRHITSLRAASRSYKHVFIITGRGLHSTGGVSTIKNKVKSRLKERNLRWSEANPGLLKVKIFSASRHSKNC